MKIIISEYSGFCYGVKRAISISEEAILNSNKNKIYSNGPLIHNNLEIMRLSEAGLKINLDSFFDINNDFLIIRAHGEGKTFFNEHRDYNLIDCTCPNVKQAQQFAREYGLEGYLVVIYGDINHQEVKGMLDWAGKKSKAVLSINEITSSDLNEKILLLAQTTQINEKFLQIKNYIENNCDEVKVKNTICNATLNRQQATLELAKKVDAMIVIGSKTSSNSRKLYELAKSINQNTCFVESASEINLDCYKEIDYLGITAGASTPSWVIEEVVQSMMMDETMESLLKDMETNIQPGDVVTGTVVKVGKDQLIVDIGMKAEGLLDISEFPEGAEIPGEGETLTAVMVKRANSEGLPVLSIRKLKDREKRAVMRENLKSFPAKFENREEILGIVKTTTKGGLIVEVDGVDAFMPASQIKLNFVTNLEPFIGKEIRARIIELDIKKKLPKIVLSQKAILMEEDVQKSKEFWDKIEVGTLVKGIAKRITNFGAFIDLGYMDGLLHISEISWDRSTKIEDVITIGEEIEVKVIEFDKAKRKISLSLKALEEEPWTLFTSNYKTGSILTGKVKNIVDYGAFVEIIPTVEGLMHISEYSHDRIEKLTDVLKIGDDIEVEILDIDENNRKISLSRKALEAPPVQKAKPIDENKFVHEDNEVAFTIGDMLKDKE